MRRILPCITVCVALIVPVVLHATTPNGRQSKIRMENAAKDLVKYADVQEGVEEVRKEIDNAQCGGMTNGNVTGNGDYNLDGSAMSPGSLPVVTGAPGRPNASPLGSTADGMGLRGDFEFPQTGDLGEADDLTDNSGAWGFVTACDMYDFEKHSPQEYAALPKEEQLNPQKLCIKHYGTANPKDCQLLYEHLVGLRKDAPRDIESCTNPDEETNEDNPPESEKPRRRYCFDEEFTYECAGSKDTGEERVLEQSENQTDLEEGNKPLGCQTRQLRKFKYEPPECKQATKPKVEADQQELDKCEDTLSNVEEDIATITKENMECAGKLQEGQTQVNGAQAELDKKKLIANAQQKVAQDAQQQANQQQANAAAQGGVVIQLDIQVRSLQKDITDLSFLINIRLQLIAQQQLIIQQLQQQIDALNTSGSSGSSDQLALLTQQLAQAQAKLQALQLELAGLQAELAKIQTLLLQAQLQLKIAQGKLNQDQAKAQLAKQNAVNQNKLAKNVNQDLDKAKLKQQQAAKNMQKQTQVCKKISKTLQDKTQKLTVQQEECNKLAAAVAADTEEAEADDEQTDNTDETDTQTPEEEPEPETVTVTEIVKPEFVQWYSTSFFRSYDVDVSAPKANTSWRVGAYCYEYYKDEKTADPLKKSTVGPPLKRDGTTDPAIKRDEPEKAKDDRPDGYSDDDEQCEMMVLDESVDERPRDFLLWPAAWREAEEQDPPEWPSGPNGKQKDIVMTPPPAPSTRATRQVTLPWVGDTKTNMSLLDTDEVKKMFGTGDGSDISPAVIWPMQVKQEATTYTAVHADVFDDSAFLKPAQAGSSSTNEESITLWLEAQQRELLKLTQPNTLRVAIPAKLLNGLNPDDPIFRMWKVEPSASDGRVEILTHTGEAVGMGPVLESLQRFFALPMREVRVPIVQPVLSKPAAASAIADWELFKKRIEEEGQAGRKQENMSGNWAKADEFIKKIQSYDEAARKVEDLRTELPGYVGKLQETQKLMRSFYASWYRQNALRIEDWKTMDKEMTATRRTVRWLHDYLLKLTQCNVDWCSNQRFTVPIYSLLDNWTSRSESERRNCLARLHVPTTSPGFWLCPQTDKVPSSIEGMKDLRELFAKNPSEYLFDFSAIGLADDYLNIPVLDITLLKVEVPLPPTDLNAALNDPKSYPDIPALPTPLLSSLAVPKVCFPEGISLKENSQSSLSSRCYDTLPPELDASNAFTIDDRYLVSTPVEHNPPEIHQKARAFVHTWILGDCPDSDGSNACDTVYSTAGYTDKNILLNPALRSRYSLLGAYCRFDQAPSVPIDRPMDLRNQKIIHVENDLQERIARYFSRWMPNRVEDFAARTARLERHPQTASQGVPRRFGNICADGLVCPLITEEVRHALAWLWLGPELDKGGIGELFSTIRTALFPKTTFTVYQNMTKTILDRYLPPDPAVFLNIDLLPQSSPTNP